jgi:hypothetical protein
MLEIERERERQRERRRGRHLATAQLALSDNRAVLPDETALPM